MLIFLFPDLIYRDLISTDLYSYAALKTDWHYFELLLTTNN